MNTNFKKISLFFAIGLSLTLITLLVSLSITVESYFRVADKMQNIFEASRLNEQIVYLDEVLTMSSIMAAHTGNLKWKKRYDEHVDKLDQAINRILALYPQADRSIKKTQNANIKLIELEARSFFYVTQGLKQDALEILNGGDYSKHKKAYIEGMEAFYQELHSRTEMAVKQEKEILMINILIQISVVVFLCISWGFIALLLNKLKKSVEREQYEQLMAANIAQTTFLSTMSHELRTPLNAIIGYSELAQESISEENFEKSQIEEDLKHIQKSGVHLIEMIGDVLDLAKIRAGAICIDKKSVDILEQIDQVIEVAEVLFSKQDNRFIKKVPVSVANIYIDPTRFRQIILNILGNSAKFTQKGEISLSIREIEEGIEVEIRDSGQGISAENLPRIFDSFIQLTDHISDSKGTGIGLTISKTLCDLMDVSVRVESTLGEGTTFTLVFPKFNPKAEKAA